MSVQGTTNYVYFTDQSLGVGATGNVYLGRHKRQGRLCACKVFRQDGGSREAIARQREFDVMRKLKHENIVEFMAIEQESRGTAQILIMEYCAGGSVYKMLEDPENAFGFNEDEFIVFLQDITKALEYLRSNGVVHRDIKPGNILRCIKDDLRSVYKLTDFGAARELNNQDEEFMSLYGTEEYLHPEVYGRALLGTRRADPLNASIDLWSLGVTIYHVATGRLPFQSFGGRQNKEEMHKIISQKKSGYISGIQESRDGKTKWDKDLPETCQLSRGLRRQLRKLLAGLLEVDERVQWTFEAFFKESRNMTSRPPIYLHCVYSGCTERLYTGVNNIMLAHVQDELASLTGLPASRQHLCHCRSPVEHLIPSCPRRSSSTSSADAQQVVCLREQRGSVGRTPVIAADGSGGGGNSWKQKTSMEWPLFLLPSTYVPAEWKLAPLELPPRPEMPSSSSVSDDCGFARSACAYVIYIRRVAGHFIYCQTQTVNCFQHLIDSLHREFQSLSAVLEVVRTLGGSLPRHHSNSGSTFSSLSAPAGYLAAAVDNAVRPAYTAPQLQHSSPPCPGATGDTTNDSLNSLQIRVSQLKHTFDEKLYDSLLEATFRHLCRPEQRCLNKLKKRKQELTKIYEDFREHKHRKELTYNEQQIHKFDRMRLTKLVSEADSYYRDHCQLNMNNFVHTVGQWYSRVYLRHRTEVKELEHLLLEQINKYSSVTGLSTTQHERPVGKALCFTSPSAAAAVPSASKYPTLLQPSTTSSLMPMSRTSLADSAVSMTSNVSSCATSCINLMTTDPPVDDIQAANQTSFNDSREKRVAENNDDSGISGMAIQLRSTLSANDELFQENVHLMNQNLAKLKQLL